MVSESNPKPNASAGESASGAGSAPPASVPVESSDWEDRFKYLLADFENFRRRTDRDRTAVRVEAEANLLRRLIPLVEGFQNAEATGRSLPLSDPLRRGLELLGRELDAVLRSVAFAPVARVGEPFRPEEHEAVGEIVGASDLSEGQVAEIVQQGYRFQGGLLRPAKVLVARAAHGAETRSTPPEEPGSKEPEDSPIGESSV